MANKLRRGIFAGIMMLILILDSKTALSGAMAGVEICIFQVIPALFPFFVLTMLISPAFTGTDIPLLRSIGRLCRMPKGSESLLILGLLGGYPAGAQAVCQACQDGQLSKEDAQRLLGFCSNAGPAFLFGIASAVFPYAWLPWALWAIHIVSALTVGILLPGGCQSSVRLSGTDPITLSKALEKSLLVMAKVCGWIVLFRIVQGFLERWCLSMLALPTQIGIIGLLELANGCLQLPLISDLGLRALLCSTFLSLGGLCVTMQTVSVTGTLGLGMYIPGKILQCSVSIILTLLMQLIFLPDSNLTPMSPVLIVIFGAFLAIFSLVLRKYEKNSSIPAMIGV